MRHWKRLLYYLLINVFVSACTMVAVLVAWERTHPPASPTAEPDARLLASATQPSSEEVVTAAPGEAEPQVRPAASEPSATSAPPPEEEAEPLEYRVQPGDTLGAIAVRFQVGLEQLMEVNGIADPDRLEIGQMLVIPLAATESPTRTSLPAEPTAVPPSPTRTPPQATGEAAVVIDSVVGAGDLDAERVWLKRVGAGELSLAGWQLLEEGGQAFTFPQLILYEGGAVFLYTRAGQQTVVELFWGLDSPVWRSGETVILKDAQGEVRATYQVP